MGKKKYKAMDVDPVLEDGEDVPDNFPQDGVKKKTKNVRARKLFHPFMSYLKSYQEFSQHLPRRFMEFDEEKLADQKEKEDESEADEHDENNGSNDGDEKASDVKAHKGPQFGSATRAKTIAELKERLAKMKGKKLDYHERLKKKGIKSRLTKKERLEERAKLKKEKMKAKKKSKGNLIKPVTNEDEKDETKPDVPKKSVPEPKMIFSKLELPDEEKYKKKVNKDPKRLLQKIQKSQTKLKTLEEKGKTETVKKIKEKLTWDKAIQKAEGVKLKDDVELLKKTIKRKTEIKNRSKKKWDQRKESVEQRKEEAQKKRKENITKKKKEKKTKKIKKSIKKGRVVI